MIMTSLSQVLAEEVAAFDERFNVKEKEGVVYENHHDIKDFLKAHDARILSAVIQELEQRKGATRRTKLFTKSYDDGHDTAIDHCIILIKNAMEV